MKTVKIKGQLLEVIDYAPYPHQTELTEDIRKWVSTKEGPQFFVPVWHRRAGKSSSLVNILIEYCCNPKTVGQYYYFYPMKEKVREHLWDNPQILQKFLPMSQVLKKDDQRMVVHFKTGSQLIFDGTDKDPDKHRGGNGVGYVVDEYDDQQEKIFDEIIRPIVEFNKGFVVLCGTPRGIKHLNRAYTAGQDPLNKKYKSYLLPGDASVNGDGKRLFDDEQLEGIKMDYVRKGIGAAYDQEYMCSFNRDANQVFRKLDQVTIDAFGNPLEAQEPYEGGVYRMGCDPAITHDYWVNSVIDLSTNHEVCIERFQPQDTNLGEARTEALFRKYNGAEILMDESGIGMIIADHLRSIGINIIPVKTAQSKEKIIANLSLQIDAQKIKLLPDPVAMAEMRDFSFNRIPSGRYQFSAPAGKHDDCVIARALACLELGEPIKIQREAKWNPFSETTGKRPLDYYKRNNTYYGLKKPN